MNRFLVAVVCVLALSACGRHAVRPDPIVPAEKQVADEKRADAERKYDAAAAEHSGPIAAAIPSPAPPPPPPAATSPAPPEPPAPTTKVDRVFGPEVPVESVGSEPSARPGKKTVPRLSAVPATSQGNAELIVPEMEELRTDRVVVRISEVSDNSVAPAGTTRIKVTKTMKAVLTGRDFDIKPLSSETQVVDPALGVTEWSWDVTPLRPGKLMLEARAGIIVDGTGKDLPVLVHTSEVTARPVRRVCAWMKVHWSEVVGAVGGTGALAWVGALWKRRKKRRRDGTDD
jgi:hypothetical protein